MHGGDGDSTLDHNHVNGEVNTGEPLTHWLVLGLARCLASGNQNAQHMFAYVCTWIKCHLAQLGCHQCTMNDH